MQEIYVKPYGNVANIKQQHDLERQTFEKQQQFNKAKMDQDLQDKLATRRTRRDHLKAQKEAAAIAVH
uniref:Uncharacterized protein n=1 Tax=Romanomermis culicivorax TaxID=13658 RepID=A0A915L6R6_ROMCU